MKYEEMIELWRTMPPGHPYFTNSAYWAEFELRRKHLMNVHRQEQEGFKG